MPYRVYVPKTWDGKASLPIILMLHGAGANEGTYLDQADGLLMKLAEQHGYIVVSPLGFTPLGAYGNPLRLPAVFGQTAAAASQRAAVTPARQRELNLSELEVMTALEIVTEEYGADRSRTFLAGHSMGSGGAWHLAARYPERWRAVAPMSGPFVDEATYPFDRIKRLPIFMTEGTGATPSLEGSRVLARYMRERRFRVRVPRGGRQPRQHGADGVAARSSSSSTVRAIATTACRSMSTRAVIGIGCWRSPVTPSRRRRRRFACGPAKLRARRAGPLPRRRRPHRRATGRSPMSAIRR